MQVIITACKKNHANIYNKPTVGNTIMTPLTYTPPHSLNYINKTVSVDLVIVFILAIGALVDLALTRM